LADLIARERVDVVHAYSGTAARCAHRAVRETGAWLVTTYAGAPPARRDLASLHHGALALGHRVLVESEHAADLVIARYRVPPERVLAIAPSIDTARFDPGAVSPERVAILRHAWGIRPGWRVVLIPGRLTRGHGQMVALDAVRILLNGGMRGVAFILAGDSDADGDYAGALGARIEAQGIGGVVRRVGRCPDMPAAYTVADLVLVPDAEPTTFSPVAAEAQAMARPVIASAIGALPEIVAAPPQVEDDARSGWLVKPGDPIELARAIAAALALDDEIRHDVGRHARRGAEVRFSPSRVAAAVLAVYSGLLEGSRAR
jgi:glycosyltransferase involved in cell wall biosynthesis